LNWPISIGANATHGDATALLSFIPSQGIVVPDDPESRPQDEAPNCDKCGKPTELVTVIGRLGKVPAYRIFRCDACNVLQWVAEQVTGGGDSA
jgi:hypothetical protein